MNLSLRLLLCLFLFSAVSLAAQVKTDPAPGVFEVSGIVRKGRTAEGQGSKTGPMAGIALPETKMGSKPKVQTGKITAKDLAVFLGKFAVPELRSNEEIESKDGSLLVKATPDKRKWIQRTLVLNRSLQKPALQIEVKFVGVSTQAFRKHVQPLLQDQNHVVLRKVKLIKLLQKILAFEGEMNLETQCVSVRPFTKSRFLSLDRMVYIKDYRPKPASKKGEHIPVFDVVRHGALLSCTTAMLTESVAGVELFLATHRLKQPMPTFKVKLGARSYVIQLPEKTVKLARCSLRLPKGEAALITGSRSKGQQVFAIVSVRPVR